MTSNWAVTRNGMRIALIVISLAIALTGCGSGNEERLEASEESLPNVAPSMPATPDDEATPTQASQNNDSHDDGVISRVKRVPGAAWGGIETAGGWVWNGLTWVWDRGADGAVSIWSAIRSSGSFLWDNVTGLPGQAWDAISRFWRWVWGTEIAVIVKDSASELSGHIAALNPANWLDGLMGVFRRLLFEALKIGMFVALIVIVFFGLTRWRIWYFALQKFWLAVSRGFAARKGAHKKSTSMKSRRARRPIPSDGTDLQQWRDQEIINANPEHDEEYVHEWRRDQIKLLRQRLSNPTITALFDLASERDGRPVNYFELMKVTSRSANQIRADFSSFTVIARSISPGQSSPIDVVAPTDDVSRRAYLIPKSYLEWWFEE